MNCRGSHPWVTPMGHTHETRCQEIVKLTLDLEQEVDGRWIAEIVELPDVLSYGATRDISSRRDFSRDQ
jgi:hypothetical protein